MKTDYTPKGTSFNVSSKKIAKAFQLKASREAFRKFVLFVSEDQIEIISCSNLLAKIILIILAPILAQAYFISGNFKGFKQEFLDVLYPVKRGSFSYVLSIKRDSEAWNKIEKIIGKKLE